MMKSSNGAYDFTIPRRQSYAAILLIAYKLYKVLLRQLLPFLLIFLFGGSLGKKDSLMYYVIGIAILGFIYSVVSFFKYYFFFRDDKLIVQKGVFKRSVIEIPFDRIQSINFEQNLIHRIFNVVKLNMDTAGSAGSELQINALDHTLASAISEHILKHKSENAVATEEGQPITESKKQVIFRLPIAQLLKVGITENHLRSGGIIIFFLIWIWENLKDIGMDVMEKMEEYAPLAEAISTSLVIIASLVILFMIVSFIISLVRTVLKYYGLQMFRIGDGFVIESGLFNKREHAAKDHKIQLVRWTQNLLQKWSSIYELRMKQASSMEVSDKKSIQVAGLEWEDIKMTEAYLFKEQHRELSAMNLHSVDPYYRFRRLYYWSVIFLPLAGLLVYLGENKFAIAAFAWFCFGVVTTLLSYNKKRYGISENLLLLKGGTFGHSATMLQLFKLQNLMIESTPFQRRRDLASLTLFTASGQVTIPDIAYDKCLLMKNYLLYKIESNSESWM